jgi:peptidyl-dipeptidase Dcp
MLSQHRDNILMNNTLFSRIKNIYQNKDDLNLTGEQKRLLQRSYKMFVRGGANLKQDEKEELKEINKKLSVLTLRFGENILKENNRFELIITNREDLAGLPEQVIKAASEAATQRGHEHTWVFTLHKPSMLPFLRYSQKRELREKIYKAYINRGDNDDELDNKEIVNQIVNLRIRAAKLLGYQSHAQYILEENMAKVPENVYELLNDLWPPSLDKAREESKAFQKMISSENKNHQLKGWDWWYYAEKVRKKQYHLDEEMLKPYFVLENVLCRGAFEVANKLYGIEFEERDDIPRYHPDVRVFEVKEADGEHIGILYTDYFPRESKRGGAWMGSYRKQCRRGGKMIKPVVTNVANFTKPTSGTPALLSWDEVLTLFHEFGHGLHGLLSDCNYEMLSGTSVARDFVELPSQIMEEWAAEPEVLKNYALHYQTGEPIPDQLIAKIKNASKFNQGFAMTEYLAASFLDMDWHTATENGDIQINKFEKESLGKIGLIPQIASRYRSTYFRHVFAGGYSAGYYSYVWAEVLSTDAFHAFKEKGLFNRELARSLRENVISKGDTQDPMILYKKFRGGEPNIEYLLEKRGLI